MTVATRFFSWQSGIRPGPPYDKGSPNIRAIRDYVLKRWGGQNLGSGVVVRPIRGGSSWSSHAFGAAFDWRYTDPGPGRKLLEAEVLPWLIDNSHELHVQRIHDYDAKDYWQAGKGWTGRSPGQGWGWLHIETHPDGYFDATPVEERIGAQPLPPPIVEIPFAPDRAVWGLWPWNKNKPTITVGDRGEVVRYLQGVLKVKAGQQLGPIDGIFGERTAAAVKAVQGFFELRPDAIVGPKTWPVIDWIAGT